VTTSTLERPLLAVQRRASVRLAVLLGAIGAAVSMLGSWIPSLWGDEAASMLSAIRPVSTLWPMLLHVDAVHGTYYLGLHFWTLVFGTSPFALRFPSAIAVGAGVAAMVLLAERLDGRRLGVVAGLVYAILPRVTSMGQEARSYAFSAAIAIWLTLLLVIILQRRGSTRRLWIAYTALLAAGIYVFLYVALIAIAHLAVILLREDRRALARSWVKAFGIAVACALPLLAVAILEHGQIAYLGTRAEVTFPTLAVSLWFGTTTFAVAAWALILAGAAMFARDVVRRRERLLAGPGSAPPAFAVAILSLLVPSVLLVGSHFLVPDFTARYLSMCAPAAALVMAVAIMRLTRGRIPLVAVVLALVGALAFPVWLSQRGPNSKNNSDWAQISQVIGANAARGDAVAFDASVRPSRLPRLAMRTYPDGFAGLKDVTLRTPYYAGTSWHDTQYSIPDAASLGRFSGVNTVWLIEYATPAHTDTYGVADLEKVGFHWVESIRDYRSVVLEFTR
jgi:mannosyltransferase